METGEKVYLVIEDWKNDSGESDIFTSAFSNFANALKYLEQLEKAYNIDYDTEECIKNNECDYNKTVDIENERGNIEVVFNDTADYYHLFIVSKIVDEEISCL